MLRLFDVGKPGSEAWNADCKSSAAGKKPTRFCISTDCLSWVLSSTLVTSGDWKHVFPQGTSRCDRVTSGSHQPPVYNAFTDVHRFKKSLFNSKTSRLVCGQANVVFSLLLLGHTRVCVQHPSTPAICGGLLSCLKFIRRWIPKGMLPHFGRKIHHLHGISRTHNQQTSPGESFAGGASNKWL